MLVITDEIIEQHADSFLPANDISRLIDVDRNTIYKWFSDGLVRRETVDRVEHSKPIHFYHVGDCIQLRLARPKPKPFRHRRIDGVVMYQCKNCAEWKNKTDYYPDTSNKVHGILSLCKDCHNEAARQRFRKPGARERTNNTRRLLLQKRAADAKAATEWAQNPTISMRRVLEMIDRVRPNSSDAMISIEAGLHEDTIRNLRRKVNDDRVMYLSTIDAMFTRLGEQDAFYELTECLDEDRPRWHKKWDYCQRCLRTSVPFLSKGLCATCYRNRHDPDFVPMVESSWSLRHARCVQCHCTDKKHAAHGLCQRCYQAHWRKSRTNNE